MKSQVNSLKIYSFLKTISFKSFDNSWGNLYIIRFEWDIIFTSSYDEWAKDGYTKWCPKEGTSTLLNWVSLYLKVVQIKMKLNLLRKI